MRPAGPAWSVFWSADVTARTITLDEHITVRISDSVNVDWDRIVEGDTVEIERKNRDGHNVPVGVFVLMGDSR